MPAPYRPLEPTGRYIRLLDIQPSKDKSAPLSCTLTHASLDRDLIYEALSYTWGRPMPKVSIQLDGQDFETLENLGAALRRLRHPKKARTFWIDALCINQMDNKEKATQLALMDQIYSNATQVIVWLGEPDDDNRSAMKSLATKTFSITNNTRIWRAQRKHGVQRGWRDGSNALLTGEADRGIGSTESEIGQVAQLLDRPWWRRVWIVQEVVLAKKIIVICGPDEVPWESIKERLRKDRTYSLNSNTGMRLPLHSHNGTVVDYNFGWPDAEWNILDKMRVAREAGTLNITFYELLFQFRRFQCTMPADRVFAFLGLVTSEQSAGITVDYDISLAELYTLTARSLMTAHKHLLILNCKREPYVDVIEHESPRLFSTLDQGRFIDPQAAVIDDPDGKPRKGWIRLPDGWERIVDNKGTWFCNHNFDEKQKKKQRDSPLNGTTSAPQVVEDFRCVPRGWIKDWDNLGRVQYMYHAKTVAKTETLDIPSWVPDWNYYSIRDPEPLPHLFNANFCYWASGKNRPIHYIPTSNPDSGVLGLRGMMFDKIDSIALPWFPEGESLPISRSGVGALDEWERLALVEPLNCPYKAGNGRYNAFWRAHIADYPGDKSLAEDEKIIFDAWCDRTGWTPKAADLEHKKFNSLWELGDIMYEDKALGEMAAHVFETSSDPEAMLAHGNTAKIVYNITKEAFSSLTNFKKRYKEVRTRIYKASRNRAMFVTSKGFIGLAPWNARKGDSIVVLLGGCTPFILRPEGEQFSFVGETYVYGIMGGELFGHEMGHARLRDFEII